MILVIGVVVVGWIVVLALVVGMLHLATSSPTPQRLAHALLAPSGSVMASADAARRAALATSVSMAELAA